MQKYSWNDVEKKVEEIKSRNLDIENAKIVLFGAGMNGSHAYKKLKDRCNIVGFSDNNKALWDKTHEGVKVIRPSELEKIENLVVILTVTGQHYNAILEQLKSLGVTFITYFDLCLSENFDKFEKVYNELLEDEFSKKTYRNLLLSHILIDENFLKEIFVRNQYFELPEFNLSTPKEVFVDCGAYAGDTMETFIINRAGTFNTMYSFEPTDKTFNAMCYRRERLLKEWALEENQVVVEQKAVGAKDGEIFFADEINAEKSNRISNKEEKKGQSLPVVSLDSYFKNIETKPTFIKADIEGAEIDLINGAKNIIVNNKPMMAICLYHSIDDLYEIPLLLKGMNPDYKMGVRHHMPNYYETVLYCY